LYNAETFIRSTLISLARQVTSPSEVIVVDDGSTDRGAEIAEAFRFPDGSSPVVVRHETPLGVAVARNHGAFVARGDWVGFCDNDDLWHPKRIAAIFACLRDHPTARAIATGAAGFALTADRVYLVAHQRVVMVNHWVPNDDIDLLVDLAGDVESRETRDIGFADLQRDTCFVTTQVCFRRDSYAMAGGCSPLFLRTDDWALNAACATMMAIVYLETPLVFYRIRATSQSHDQLASALPLLACLLAMRFGRDLDSRPTGPLYHHLVRTLAQNRAPFALTLGFALLGQLNVGTIGRLVEAGLRCRVPPWHILTSHAKAKR
jgi:glycosyltransferase involved in cell wall biosynthesis